MSISNIEPTRTLFHAAQWLLCGGGLPTAHQLEQAIRKYSNADLTWAARLLKTAQSSQADFFGTLYAHGVWPEGQAPRARVAREGVGRLGVLLALRDKTLSISATMLDPLADIIGAAETRDAVIRLFDGLEAWVQHDRSDAGQAQAEAALRELNEALERVVESPTEGIAEDSAEEEVPA